ncbi:DinB family protein [Jatrophihabitans telluris]|uniref:DinB family protein n=1 Tax=Jatrophihabitans telluris TaxID=2038343 RepID=A0ABY4R239_9ACTN|nr:DinB family protein [Jatrophihabitans telluris]UQX89109.1 DinB family protein [Jatrophihabitans telluris]
MNPVSGEGSSKPRSMAGEPSPADIPPDDKDWTWTLHRRCPDCGYSAAGVTGATVGAVVLKAAERWQSVLARSDVRVRPAPTVWSALEYGCHTRDVMIRMTGRLALMLDEDEPTFPNWDQDETAVAERYWEQDPVTVARQLADTAETTARAFSGVRADQRSRRGMRSNGSQFTVETLSQYFLHDIVHHLHDVDG